METETKEIKLREHIDRGFPRRVSMLRKKLPAGEATQVIVAEAIGISRSHLANIEAGRTPPSIEVLDKLAAHFNVPRAFLARGERTPRIIDGQRRLSAFEQEPNSVTAIYERLSPTGQQLLISFGLWLQSSEAGEARISPPPG